MAASPPAPAGLYLVIFELNVLSRFLDLENFGQKVGHSGKKYLSQSPSVKVVPLETTEYVKEEGKVENKVISNLMTRYERNTKLVLDLPQREQPPTIYSETEGIIQDSLPLKLPSEKTGYIGPTVFYAPHSQSEVSYLAV